MIISTRRLVRHILCIIALLSSPGTGVFGSSDPLAKYNVVWDSPSLNSSGAMPIGNGEIGLTVWVEQNGDLLMYLNRTDAWCEYGRLLKLGRVRISLSPNPFRDGIAFRQELNLRNGEIVIDAGADTSSVRLSVWVDANNPVVHVTAEGKQAFAVTAALENWRTSRHVLGKGELLSCWHMAGWDQDHIPVEVVSTPDVVVPESGDRILWYHRNETSVWSLGMKHQGLASVMGEFSDPLLHRTFGGTIFGKGLIKADARTLKAAAPRKQWSVSIYPFTEISPTAGQWVADLDNLVKRTEGLNAGKTLAKHRAWWNDFWDRSWIRLSGDENAETVTRAYTLQRFVAACAGRGNCPIKFNGSLFNVEARIKDNGEDKFDPDYRRWGGDYWWQNTRLPYWPMLAAGDFDLMQPLFRMYENSVPLARERTRVWFNAKGVFFPETMSFWGMYSNGDYGWDRQGKKDGEVANTYIRYYWQQGLELVMMMLDWYEHTMDRQFLANRVLPMADQVLLYFDTRFPRENGKIVIKPGQSLETWQEAVDALPEVAGLHAVLARLLALPAGSVNKELAARWQRLRGEIPDVPLGTDGEKTRILPARTFGKLGNVENPELYAIFPYRMYGAGKPDLDVALHSFDLRRFPGGFGWGQDGIQAARLGMTDEARALVVTAATSKDEGSRFPIFWGPNFDWIPDQDHGSNMMNTLQTMIMQTEGKTISLLPAWPAGWNAEFRLHAPYKTVVEGIVRNGKIVSLNVTPTVRKKDVVIVEPRPAAPVMSALSQPVAQFPVNVVLSSATAGVPVYYTLDGTTPTPSSMRCEGSVRVSGPSRLLARAISATGRTSALSENLIVGRENGLRYKYYEGAWQNLPDFDSLKPAGEGVALDFNPSLLKKQPDHFGIVYEGFINLPATGEYTFAVMSDDGSRLLIDGNVVVDNDGSHSAEPRSGVVQLSNGRHHIRILYFDDTEGESLRVSYSLKGVSSRPVTMDMLYQE